MALKTPGFDRRPLATGREGAPLARALAAALIAVGAVLWWRTRAVPERHDFVGPTMGTSYRVTVDADLTDEEVDRAGGVIEGVLGRIEELMSTYDTASELSRFNRHRGVEPYRVSAELLAVVELALRVAERSDGAFDPTVGPLVEAWGFGPGAGPVGPLRPQPTEGELTRLRERVGHRLLSVDRDAGTLAKADPLTSVDLSGIAKGYAAEEVAEALRELGLERLLVDVGGELQAVGTPRSGRPWRVAIESPDASVGEPWGVIELSDEAIATSGDYRDYYEIGAERYAHIVDPRSGRPVRMREVSVSVVHPSGPLADAWATALLVLGPVDGRVLSEREGLAALFLARSGEDIEATPTSAMGDRVEPVEAGR